MGKRFFLSSLAVFFSLLLQANLPVTGEEAEKVNAAVFRAATGPTREIVKKMSQQ